MKKKLAVIAIGGNSLITDNDHVKVEEQYEAVCTTVRHIVDLIELDYNVLITHGNGPQVGYILRRAEIARDVEGIHEVPLLLCGADTQGSIGFYIQMALDNEFAKRGMDRQGATLVTQVEVDANDPAFKNPAKPIGAFFSEEQVEVVKKEHPDWTLVSDAGRGWRRVVPSPMPKKIVELDVIKTLLNSDVALVAGGGGGLPVVKTDGQYRGIDAVIDKDRATSLLAADLGADLLIISTGVPQVAIRFNTPEQENLSSCTLAEIEQYAADGHFAPGSMLPKVEAVMDFIKAGGKEAIITSPDMIREAVINGKGTHITE